MLYNINNDRAAFTYSVAPNPVNNGEIVLTMSAEQILIPVGF